MGWSRSEIIFTSQKLFCTSLYLVENGVTHLPNWYSFGKTLSVAWQSSIVWDDTLLCLNDDDIKKCKWGQIKCLHRWRDEEEDVSPLARVSYTYFATSLVFASCLLLRPRVYDLFAECGRNDINLTVATINRTSRRLTSLNNSKQKFISNLHRVLIYLLLCAYTDGHTTSFLAASSA